MGVLWSAWPWRWWSGRLSRTPPYRLGSMVMSGCWDKHARANDQTCRMSKGKTYFSLSELLLARGHGVVVLVAFAAG
jgi:hypothetical protein